MLCKYIYIYILYLYSLCWCQKTDKTKLCSHWREGGGIALGFTICQINFSFIKFNQSFFEHSSSRTRFPTQKLSYKNLVAGQEPVFLSVDERPRWTSQVRKLWSLEKSGNHCSKQSWMTPFTTSPCFNVSSEMLSRCPVVPYAVWIKRKRFSPRPKCKSSPRVYVHIRSPGVFPGASASLNSNCQLSNHWMLQRFWLQSLLPSTSTWARGTAYKQKSALSSSHIICILCRLPLTEVRITKSCNVFISTATEGRWICFYST